MIKQFVATAFLAVLAGILIFNIIDARESDEPANTGVGLETGQKAPDFELTTLDGESVKLSDYRGKKVFINFWATWCGPCKEEMPAMEEFYQENKKDVVILAVNALNTELDGRKKVSSFVDDHNLTFPIVLDEKGEVLEEYLVTHMPTTYFIGTDGVIQEPAHRGAIDKAFMEKMKEKLD